MNSRIARDYTSWVERRPPGFYDTRKQRSLIQREQDYLRRIIFLVSTVAPTVIRQKYTPELA